jgi:two-component system, sensor histidine kinase and response regulator
MNSESEITFKRTILIVDDSSDNLRVLSTTLTEHGYKTRCATNGEMALVSINHLPPDLILLDIRMPGTDGYEICRQLKANPKTKSIPVIFLSAADDTAGKVKAFNVGGVDYITKPFQTEEVLARIVNQLTIQQLQNQLVEQNKRLQQEIDQHKKTEIALQDAKESAEAANYVKSKFLANMNHELRTPLNAILGFTELMQSDPSLSDEYQNYLSSINQSGHHLLKLLNHVLAVTSAEANKISVNQHDFDIYQLLHAIAPPWQKKSLAKGLQFIIECATAVPQYIHSDENKLRHILTNLLENAIRFTHSGSVILRIKVKNEIAQIQKSGTVNNAPSPQSPIAVSSCLPQPPITLLFEVEDTGSGIAAYEMNRLFQVFSQTESGRQSERGLGLGLFISRQFIQVLGGDITITSTPNQGTLVRFYILVSPASVTSTQEQPINSMGDRASAYSFQPLINPISDYSEAWMLEALRTQMPADWLAQLQQAAIKGFDHQISHLIQKIPETHAPLAKALADWNQNFQFDRIVTITQQVLERTP